MICDSVLPCKKVTFQWQNYRITKLIIKPIKLLDFTMEYVFHHVSINRVIFRLTLGTLAVTSWILNGFSIFFFVGKVWSWTLCFWTFETSVVLLWSSKPNPKWARYHDFWDSSTFRTCVVHHWKALGVGISNITLVWRAELSTTLWSQKHVQIRVRFWCCTNPIKRDSKFQRPQNESTTCHLFVRQRILKIRHVCTEKLTFLCQAFFP